MNARPDARADLLETAPCGFVSVSNDGTILLVNQCFADLLDSTRDELVGRNIQLLLTPGNRVFYQTHFFPLLRLQGRADEIYLTLRRSDGEDVPVLVNAVMYERDGAIVVDCMMMRIHQRKLYEDAILQAKRAAEEAAASKEKFLSMMSHDLRTPLQAITGYASVLLEGFHGELSAEQRTDVEEIRTAARDVSRMINDILDFARLDRGTVRVDLRSVSIPEALSRAEAMVRLRMEEAGLVYSREDCENVLTARADPDRLQQVLLNLLTNAIKFTSRGGRIHAICGADDEWIHLRVADTGAGIPADKLAGIFEPFVQVQPDARGVGLGLAISRELTRAMGGELSVQSMVGQGSTFTISLRRP
ncbi:MAG TPA: HAMP domain-containing sensor histidine kinase [Thermoanaerobaculia bacterium]|nr:HAMP domain-containing sensor histidine kinase [Thermoanaerobaculia bacterium]